MFEKLLLQILNMSFTASFVILAVIVARLLLKKAPRMISYALWAVVLFRLICPFSFESAVSLLPMNANPIPQGIVYQQTPQIETGIPIVNNSVNAVLPAATPDASMNPLQGWLAIGTFLWLCGIAVLAIYSTVSLLLLKRKLRDAICENENVYLAEGLASPFVMGLFRPKIYLPASLTDNEKRYILLHEQTHIKRLDHVVKILSFAVLCLHWFNPLAWIAFLLCGKDMEMSCDEAVIKRLGSEIKKEYSSSLLALATGRRIVGGSPLAFGEGDTKSRIKNVLNYKKPAFWLIVVSIIAVVAVGVGLISNPKQARSFVMTGTNLSDLQPENIVQHIAGITMVDAAELEVTEDNFSLTVSSDFSLVNSEAIRFVFSNRQNKPQSAQLRIFLEDSSFFVTEPVDWVASEEDIFKLRYYLEALKYLPKEEIASLCKVSPERYAIEIAQGDRKRDSERCIYFDKDGVTAEQSWRIRLDIMPLYGEGSIFNGTGSDTIHLYYSEVADTAALSDYKPAIMINNQIYWLSTDANPDAASGNTWLFGQIKKISPQSAPPSENFEAIGLDPSYVGKDIYISPDGNTLYLDSKAGEKTLQFVFAKAETETTDPVAAAYLTTFELYNGKGEILQSSFSLATQTATELPALLLKGTDKTMPSVNDAPQDTEEYLKITIGEQFDRVYFVYESEGKYWVEHPYDYKRELDKNTYESLMKYLQADSGTIPGAPIVNSYYAAQNTRAFSILQSEMLERMLEQWTDHTIVNPKWNIDSFTQYHSLDQSMTSTLEEDQYYSTFTADNGKQYYMVLRYDAEDGGGLGKVRYSETPYPYDLQANIADITAKLSQTDLNLATAVAARVQVVDASQNSAREAIRVTDSYGNQYLYYFDEPAAVQ